AGQRFGCPPRRARSRRPRRSNSGEIDKVATGSYFSRMRSVRIQILKKQLSEYVRLAPPGETVLVTDRDRVVAELGPARPGFNKPDADAAWAELIRHGIVTPARNLRAPLPPKNYPPVMTFAELMAELDKDREDR